LNRTSRLKRPHAQIETLCWDCSFNDFFTANVEPRTDTDELFRRLRYNAPTEYPGASAALVTLGLAAIDWLPKPGVTKTSGFFVGRVAP
jgi:hypothetical protein